MKLVSTLLILSFALLEARGSPYAYFSSSGTVDTLVRPGDATRGGVVLSRSYDPYYNHRAVRSGPPTYSLRQPETKETQLARHYHAAARRQALLEVNDTPPQEYEIYFPQIPESSSVIPNESTELFELEKTEIVPTSKAVPEVEPEIEVTPEAPIQNQKNVVDTKQQAKKPVDDDEDDEDDSNPNYPKFPAGVYFPMFFGWGGRSGSDGPVAIANSFSTGRGGVSASDATAYGTPKFEEKL